MRSTRYSLARVYYLAEMWEEAESMFKALHREFPGDVDYLGYLGSVSGRLGNWEDALKISEQLAELDKPYLFGSNRLWRARIAASLGEKEKAVSLIHEALSQGVSFYNLYIVLDFELLSDYPAYQELMKPKG